MDAHLFVSRAMLTPENQLLIMLSPLLSSLHRKRKQHNLTINVANFIPNFIDYDVILNRPVTEKKCNKVFAFLLHLPETDD